MLQQHLFSNSVIIFSSHWSTIYTSCISIDLASAQENDCTEFGAVWLESSVFVSPNVGRVNFCNGSRWGTICDNDWDHFDAAVVCRELGYTADGKFLSAFKSKTKFNYIIFTMQVLNQCIIL